MVAVRLNCACVVYREKLCECQYCTGIDFVLLGYKNHERSQMANSVPSVAVRRDPDDPRKYHIFVFMYRQTSMLLSSGRSLWVGDSPRLAENGVDGVRGHVCRHFIQTCDTLK